MYSQETHTKLFKNLFQKNYKTKNPIKNFKKIKKLCKPLLISTGVF